MLRLAGCLMLIISSSLCGLEMSSRLKRRTLLLRKTAVMLEYIGEKIRYERPIKDELISSLSDDERYSELFSDKAVCLMREIERSSLTGFFNRLGTTDVQGQEALTAIAVSEFRKYASEAETEEKNKCRLYEVLGFMSGAFIAVMTV